VQFPWRWMAILAVALAVFLAAAVNHRRHAWLWLVLVAGILAGTGALHAKHAWWDAEDFAATQEMIEQGDGFEGTDEYDPAGDDHTDLPAKMPQAYAANENGQKMEVPGTKILVQLWSAEEKIVRVETKDDVIVALRLLDYPAWRVEINGKQEVPEHPEGTRQIMVSLAAGEWQIKAKFQRTWDGTLGGIVSSASLLLALFLSMQAKIAPAGA